MDIRNRIFYTLKPLLPRLLQLEIRRRLAKRRRKCSSSVWPIDERAGRVPKGWKGWPGGKRFAFVLMHDVDTAQGQRKVRLLLELEETHGVRSSFNFVPERYPIDLGIQDVVRASGCEVGVHGLKHDGKLFHSRPLFQKQAERINWYLRKWNAAGFSSPSMLRNLEWTLDLDILYDVSTFDTDPFEPQPDPVGTIFPFVVVKEQGKEKRFVELPYTLPQDHCLFVILREKDSGVWKEKLDWVAEKGGMALLNTHPDYMGFGGRACGREEYPHQNYVDFLKYVKSRYGGQYWHALPRDVAEFWLKEMAHHSTGPCPGGDLRFQDGTEREYRDEVLGDIPSGARRSPAKEWVD